MYLECLPHRSTATLAAVPDMSLIPVAPFENLGARFRVKIRRGIELGFVIMFFALRACAGPGVV